MRPVQKVNRNYRVAGHYQNQLMDIQSAIFVMLVTLIIISISSVYINIYIASLFHQARTFFLIYFPIYGAILILLLVSYFRAVFTLPGYTDSLDNNKYSPEEFAVFRQNTQKQKMRRQQRKKKRYGSDPTEISQLKETAFCEKCQAVKPPRAHHCKLCQKCILRMDHHCPWVGNCIGIRNHKYFMLFLLYATVGLTMTWITIIIDAFQDWKYVSTFYDQDTATYAMIAAAIASVLLSLSIGALFIGQVIGLKQNLTTLESFVPHIEQSPPFDKGSWEDNLADIFGEKYWLLPVQPFPKTEEGN